MRTRTEKQRVVGVSQSKTSLGAVAEDTLVNLWVPQASV